MEHTSIPSILGADEEFSHGILQVDIPASATSHATKQLMKKGCRRALYELKLGEDVLPDCLKDAAQAVMVQANDGDTLQPTRINPLLAVPTAQQMNQNGFWWGSLQVKRGPRVPKLTKARE